MFKVTLSLYQVNAYRKAASKHAYVFGQVSTALPKVEAKVQKALQVLEDENIKDWAVPSALIVFVAFLGLPYFEVHNLSMGLASGNDASSEWKNYLLAVVLTGVGLLGGFYIHSGQMTDPVDGRKRITFKWLLGWGLALGYIFIQYFVSHAAQGADTDSIAVKMLQYLAVGIAIAEVIIGITLLPICLKFLTLWSCEIKKYVLQKRKYESSKATDFNHRDYILYAKAYEEAHPGKITIEPMSKNMEQAINFYNSTK